jgi:hypothetical protein
MALVNSTLGTSPGNIYISSGNTAISTMYFCNRSASTVTFNLYALSFGNSVAGVTSIIYSNLQLASNDTYVIDWEKLVLGNGDQLQANASAGSAVTATISYVGI